MKKVIERTSVNSSVISSVGYDLETQTLEIEFGSGSVYEYYDVPEDVYQDFMASDSHGQFFNTHIKDQYTFQQIQG